MIKIKKVAEKQKMQNEKEVVVRLEEEAKKLVIEQFYKQIKVFEKKVSERMLIRKMQDYTIDLKKRFVPRKEKIYLLSREEREKVQKFIQKQMRKKYIWLSKLLQCHMPSLLVWKTHYHSLLLVNIQSNKAYLPQQLPYLQHASWW